MIVQTVNGTMVNLANVFALRVYDHGVFAVGAHLTADDQATRYHEERLCWCRDEEHGREIIARLFAAAARGARAVTMGSAGDPVEVSLPGKRSTYMPQEETRRLALRAARELAAAGERVTFRSVADRAGLKYSQVVYAFGRVQHLREELAEPA